MDKLASTKKNRARLIQKVNELDPPTWASCRGTMGIVSFIEDPEIVKKSLKYLGLLDLKPRPPPKAKAPSPSIHIVNSNLSAYSI